VRNKILTGAAFTAALSGLIALEGMKTEAYKDIAGIPTICAGTTRNVKMGDTKTKQQCWSIAEAEFREYEKFVIDKVKVPLNPNQQTSLVWFTINVGKYGFADSTALTRFNRGDYTGGCNALAMWDKVTINGKKVVSKGLQNRRAAEVSLCLKPYPSSF
jgi:lysozyme